MLSSSEGHTWVKVRSGISKGFLFEIDRRLESHYEFGTHEVEVQRALERLVRPGSVVYDVGAHVGFFSIGLTNLVGLDGRIVAFEPDPDNAKRLEANILENGIQERVRVVETGVWSSSGSQKFRRASDNRTKGRIEFCEGMSDRQANRGFRIRTVSLDDLFRSGELPPSLIKIDVEGGEKEVIVGAEQMINAVRPVIVCETHSRDSRLFIESWLIERSYFVSELTMKGRGLCNLLAVPLAGENSR